MLTAKRSGLRSQDLIAFRLVQVGGGQQVTQEMPPVLLGVVVTRPRLPQKHVPLKTDAINTTFF